MEEKTEAERKEEPQRVRLEKRDYLAFTVALFETSLLPIILLIIALLIFAVVVSL